MRRWSVLVGFAFACSCTAGAARPPDASIVSGSAAHPVVVSSLNTTGLALEVLVPPVSHMTVQLESPRPAERIVLAAARSYEIRWSCQRWDADALGLDVALDSFRPRRVAAGATALPLGTLVPVGQALLPGEHWLFIAPVAASGLVPAQATRGGGPSAKAVPFLVGDAPPQAVSGAVWLRKPEGTYNGLSAEHVLFDALVFGEDGQATTARATIILHGAARGRVIVPGPFAVQSLASGDYEVRASAPGALPAQRVFTVNSELGRAK